MVLEKNLNKRIHKLLPFRNNNGIWRRIHRLEQENEAVVNVMTELSDYYKQVFPEPREIYLAIHEVRSSTVYIRWRKKGVNGNQKYLVMDGIEGRDFLMQQTTGVRELYQSFNQAALELNLAYSLRINEIRRIKKYLNSLSFAD